MTAEMRTTTATRRRLGARLAELRTAAGLTQSALAARIGFSRSTIGNIEIGHQSAGAGFWRACDEALSAGGALLAAAGPQSPGQADGIDRTVIDLAGALAADAGAGQAGLREEFFSAYRHTRRCLVGRPALVLVGGHAGSGKTEFSRALSCLTGWAIVDKDTATRALVEGLLRGSGEDPDDRHTPFYRHRVRPLEYRCVLDAAFENLRSGVSTVVAAPFATEFADRAWRDRVRNRARACSAVLHVVWMRCDQRSMHDRVTTRGAARDRWKLRNWPEYLTGIDPDFVPPFRHHLVDNRLDAAVALADQARALAAGALR